MLPTWLLKEKYRQGSRRLQKLVPFKKEIVATIYPGVSSGTRYEGNELYPWTDTAIRFKYWRGTKLVNQAPNFQTMWCRYCGYTTYSDGNRFEHARTSTNCALRLEQAFTLLRKDPKCVVCNTITENREFNLIMCKGEPCKDTWRWYKPESLRQAIDLTDGIDVATDRIYNI